MLTLGYFERLNTDTLQVHSNDYNFIQYLYGEITIKYNMHPNNFNTYLEFSGVYSYEYIEDIVVGIEKSFKGMNNITNSYALSYRDGYQRGIKFSDQKLYDYFLSSSNNTLYSWHSEGGLALSMYRIDGSYSNECDLRKFIDNVCNAYIGNGCPVNDNMPPTKVVDYSNATLLGGNEGWEYVEPGVIKLKTDKEHTLKID